MVISSSASQTPKSQSSGADSTRRGRLLQRRPVRLAKSNSMQAALAIKKPKPVAAFELPGTRETTSKTVKSVQKPVPSSPRNRKRFRRSVWTSEAGEGPEPATKATGMRNGCPGNPPSSKYSTVVSGGGPNAVASGCCGSITGVLPHSGLQAFTTVARHRLFCRGPWRCQAPEDEPPIGERFVNQHCRRRLDVLASSWSSDPSRRVSTRSRYRVSPTVRNRNKCDTTRPHPNPLPEGEGTLATHEKPQSPAVCHEVAPVRAVRSERFP